MKGSWLYKHTFNDGLRGKNFAWLLFSNNNQTCKLFPQNQPFSDSTKTPNPETWLSTYVPFLRSISSSIFWYTFNAHSYFLLLFFIFIASSFYSCCVSVSVMCVNLFGLLDYVSFFFKKYKGFLLLRICIILYIVLSIELFYIFCQILRR